MTASPRRRALSALVGVTVLALAGCSDPAGPEVCSQADTIALDGGSCLVFQDGGRLGAQRAAVEQTVVATMAAVRPLIPVDGVEISILSGTRTVIPELGIGGRAFDGVRVQMTLDPNSPNLMASLPTELFSLLSHELHHIARMRTVGYGDDLLGAMISEGLADHFSVQVAGVQPPRWSTALTGPQLDTWLTQSRSEWSNRNYDHDAWFFGQSTSVPRWAGYSIGYELVRVFVNANSGRLASDMHDEPATSFIPRSPAM